MGYFQTKNRSKKNQKFQTQGGGNRSYFEHPGEFLCEVKSIELSAHKNAYVIELNVLEAATEDDATDAAYTGSTRGVVFKSNEYQEGNAARFLCALEGGDPSNQDDMDKLSFAKIDDSLEAGYLGKLKNNRVVVEAFEKRVEYDDKTKVYINTRFAPYEEE